MLILPQKVEIKWSSTSRQHYIDLGYIYNKMGELFTIDVLDLSHGSTVKVNVKCDFCGETKQLVYRSYLKLQSDKYCCPDCLSHKKKTRDENGNLQFIEINYRNKDWLCNEYITNNRQAQDIADECEIDVRTLREWISILELDNKSKVDTSFIGKESLVDLYIVQMKNSIEIGKMFGVSDYLIRRQMRDYSIKIPTRSELTNRYLYNKGGIDRLRKYANDEENRIGTSCRTRGIKRAEFNGFSKSKSALIRSSSLYEEWRINVFERDGYICQCCNKHGGDLQAHHIENFSSNEDKRLDIDNGITLCKQCHSPSYCDSFHSTYGVKNNNKEQLTEYIKTRQSEVA